MPILREIPISIDEDQVIRFQGAPAAVIRKRRPKLVEKARAAVAEGMALIQPVILYRELAVERFRHEKLFLEGGLVLSSGLIAQHLGPAQSVIVALCTIGSDLERVAAERFAQDALLGHALDALGSAAVEALVTAFCGQITARVESEGLQVSSPLSPGMEGWSIDTGQTEIFQILNSEEIGVKLLKTYLMAPVKTVSVVFGLGAEIEAAESLCDFCAMRDHCLYRDHDA